MPCDCQAVIAGARESADLPGMIATLGSYDRFFGPYHIQTLTLAFQVAEVLVLAGETDVARPLLERVVRDLGRSAGRTHDLRIDALDALFDLLTQEGEVAAAVEVGAELAECRVRVARGAISN